MNVYINAFFKSYNFSELFANIIIMCKSYKKHNHLFGLDVDIYIYLRVMYMGNVKKNTFYFSTVF